MTFAVLLLLATHTIHAAAQALKSAGLRDRSTLEAARTAFDQGLHRLKVQLGAEDPTVAERATAALADARTRADAILASLSSGVHDKAGATADSAAAAFASLRDDTSKALSDAGLRGRAALNTAWSTVSSDFSTALGLGKEGITGELRAAPGSHVDAALKSAGLRDRSTLEAARTAFDQGLHRLKMQLGAEDPDRKSVV